MDKKILGISVGIVVAVIVGGLILELVKAPIMGLFSKNSYDNTFDPTATSADQLRQLAEARETKFVRDENGKLYKVSAPKGFNISDIKFPA